MNCGAFSVNRYPGMPDRTNQRFKNTFAICADVILEVGIARVDL